MTVRWGIFVEERASEEEGSELLNRECLFVADTKASAEEHLDPTDGLMENLTSRIRFYVAPVEVEGGKMRRP